jgi:hypothetical protein
VAPEGTPGQTKVERTGIALVHEGEYIIAAAGSEAQLSIREEPEHVVNYYFPIEVEVIGDLSAHMLGRIARHVFNELDSAFRSANA